MAVELGILGQFIEEQLAKLPKDHPDRELLMGTLRIARGKNADLQLTPKDKLEKIVYSHPLVSAGTIRNNKVYLRDLSRQYGEDYIGNLLPTDARCFKSVSNILGRNRVKTIGELAGKTEDEIEQMRDVGDMRKNIILALRDVAIAEIEDRQTSASQNPTVQNA